MFQTSHLIVVFTALTNPPGWGLDATIQEKITSCQKTFEAYVDTTESRVDRIQKAEKAISHFLDIPLEATASSSSQMAPNASPELNEALLLKRLFADKAKKEAALRAFLTEPSNQRQQLILFLKEFEEKQIDLKSTDHHLLLKTLLHQRICAKIQEPTSATSFQIAQKTLTKNEKNNYLIPDEEYYPLALMNLFTSHVFEKWYKK